jgi:hypothetical protein
MMADRGISVTHTTILRCVPRYLPEFEALVALRSARVVSFSTEVRWRGGQHVKYTERQTKELTEDRQTSRSHSVRCLRYPQPRDSPAAMKI